VAEHSRTSQALGELKNTVVRIEEQLGELQRFKLEFAALTTMKTDVAVLKKDVEKLEKVKEEWSRRIWAMAGPISRCGHWMGTWVFFPVVALVIDARLSPFRKKPLFWQDSVDDR
jgi:hypothetical protein